jgi:hypothetical protein
MADLPLVVRILVTEIGVRVKVLDENELTKILSIARREPRL